MRSYHLLILSLVLIFSAGMALAQVEMTEVEHACCKYEICLKTENNGTVTSTLIHLTRLYYLYPEEDYSKISARLDTLIMEHKSDQITMMAVLVNQYLKKERDLDWLMAYSYEEIYNFYTMLSESSLKDIAMKK